MKHGSPSLLEAPSPLHTPQLRGDGPYRSFWMAGFDGADHVNRHGQPVDMVYASGHLHQVADDYARLAALRLLTVRESAGWRVCESPGGELDLSRVTLFARTAQHYGLQVMWTLMHYGTPSDVTIGDARFTERFVRFAAAIARALRPLYDVPPIYTPINEIGFLAWAVSATDLMQPYAGSRRPGPESSVDSGFDLKCRLVEAALKAMDAMRQEDPRARFLHIEPLVHVVPPPHSPKLSRLAAQVRDYQWQTWDLIEGRLCPELGGSPEALDLMGVNHYDSGQWEVGTEARVPWQQHDPRWRPFSQLLKDAWERYRRPLLVAETGHVGDGRAHWLDEMASEVESAGTAGVPVQGMCLYPAVDRPDWNDTSRWQQSGLWDVDTHASRSSGAVGPAPRMPGLQRQLNQPYVSALKRWQRRLPSASFQETACCP